MSPSRLLRPESLAWRTGRRVGRTIFVQLGPTPDETDPLIGVMDTKALAQAAVRAHNAALVGVTPAPRRGWRGRRPVNEDAQAPAPEGVTPPNPVPPPTDAV